MGDWLDSVLDALETVLEHLLEFAVDVLETLAGVDGQVWLALGTLLSGIGSVVSAVVALKLANRHTNDDAA